MCSIFGVIGKPADVQANIDRFRRLRENAKDRGRDGGRFQFYRLGDELICALGNWRATPTTELKVGKLQPYGGLVHNGTIANDKELGGKEGEIDSEVLARVLNRETLSRFTSSLRHVEGSYALACVDEHRRTVFAACNYKPLYYWRGFHGNLYFSSMERHFEGVVPWDQAPRQLAPYTTIDFSTGHTQTITRKSNPTALVVCSGGLDSTVAAAKLKAEGYLITLLHFNYGARAMGEEDMAINNIAKALGCQAVRMNIDYRAMTGGSPLLNTADSIADAIKGAEYAHEWVPARNLLMLAHAAAYAEANGYHYIAIGNNLEEAGAYPDNEEQMTYLFDKVLNYAVQNGYSLRVVAPVGRLMKHEIVKLGLELKAPLEHTWSCYRSSLEPTNDVDMGLRHCGKCGPCFMRRMAFERNGAKDPVPYAV